MRVVLDSNVIVAAYATHGLCHSLLELGLVNHTLIVSNDILNEVAETLEKKMKVPRKVVKEILDYLAKNALVQQPIELPKNSCRDRNDVKILGLAVASQAHCLVSGDQDLLVIKKINDIPILSPREFYSRLQQDIA